MKADGETGSPCFVQAGEANQEPTLLATRMADLAMGCVPIIRGQRETGTSARARLLSGEVSCQSGQYHGLLVFYDRKSGLTASKAFVESVKQL